jgi:hypothetical protein
MARVTRIVLAVVCFAMLALPLLFLFAQPRAAPGYGAMSNLYSSLVPLLGEASARLLFCFA